jgi:hypothetical protein
MQRILTSVVEEEEEEEEEEERDRPLTAFQTNPISSKSFF